MVIERGKEWGSVVDHLGQGEPLHDDLAAELGLSRRRAASRWAGPWRELPVDVLRVALTKKNGNVIEFTTSTNVVAGRRLWGHFCIASSTSFVNRRRVFSRAHPNDGRLDSLELNPAMSIRQRLLFFHRLRSEMHLPHPQATTTSRLTFETKFERPVRVRSQVNVRGVVALRITVIPDGSMVYVPANLDE